MSGGKRAGDYLAAIFKLGRTERRAKAAYRSIETNDARFGDLERRFDHLQRQLDEQSDRWEGRARHLMVGVKQAIMVKPKP